jgi:CheY-like chemotaxis protein
VHRVGDVTTALTTLDHVVFDLLVSDLGLPDGSGIDLMQTLRERGRSLPGVALTGYGRVADVQATLQAGFAAHVVKPIDMDRLLQVLGEVSERAGLQP